MNRYRKHVCPKLFDTAIIVLTAILLSSCSKTTECDFDGKHETRKLKDCDGEIEYQKRAFNLRIDVLDKVITEEQFNNKSEQLEKTFTSFIIILEFAKLRNLADPVVSEQFRQKLIEWFEDAAGG